MEEIDDEADMYGIDFVKSDDEHTAKTVGGVFSSPSLVYFRKGIPLVYDGTYDLIKDVKSSQNLFDKQRNFLFVNVDTLNIRWRLNRFSKSAVLAHF